MVGSARSRRLGRHERTAAAALQVSGVPDLRDASGSYSEWNDPAWDINDRRVGFDRLLREAWRSRAYGDFWSHMMVAEGSVDFAVEPELSVWDMAALIPVVEEAGGTITRTRWHVTAGRGQRGLVQRQAPHQRARTLLVVRPTLASDRR